MLLGHVDLYPMAMLLHTVKTGETRIKIFLGMLKYVGMVPKITETRCSRQE